MVRNQMWRLSFQQRFGFLPHPRERERFLHYVEFRDGKMVWRGPETYQIKAAAYDPGEIACAMLGENVSRATGEADARQDHHWSRRLLGHD